MSTARAKAEVVEETFLVEEWSQISGEWVTVATAKYDWLAKGAADAHKRQFSEHSMPVRVVQRVTTVREVA
jgi:hypothetical protein